MRSPKPAGLHSFTPAVSVLMPCYNAAETLEEAVLSIERQTLQDYEVVAVDDGSQDASLELLKSWEARDNRVRLLPMQHRGIVAALNAGLETCRAPWVARMDADDRSHPTRLARQAEYLAGHPEIGVVSCLVDIFPAEQVREGFQIYTDWLNSLVTAEEIRREIFVESPVAHPSVMFRKSLALAAGGYQEHGWAEDYDLWLRLYLNGVRFAKIPEILLDWREGPARLTRTDSRYSLENFLRAKAHYLVQGPLQGREAVIIWGAGMIGRRLSKYLLREGEPLAAFIDIDPRKIGRTRRGLPVLPPEELLPWWRRSQNPVVLAAVGARGARQIIRERLNGMGLREGIDWWGVA
jgi:glycosyltransferase involved in cell wall biosynthesis